MEPVLVTCQLGTATREYANKYGSRFTPWLLDVYGSSHALEPFGIWSGTTTSCQVEMKLEESTVDFSLVVFGTPALNTGSTKAWVLSSLVQRGQ